MESCQLIFDSFLLSCHLINVAITELKQSLTLGIIGLIDLTTIGIERKEIVHRHRSCVIQTARHHRLTIQERFQITVFHPEKRILSGLSTKIIVTQHHRAKRQHLDVERRIGLIIISTLFQIELPDF